MRRINSIKIKNIKGIDDKSFDLNIIPDKPSIIVAPNGFGKSSITAAFKSLNNRRIDLQPIDCHLNNESLNPELELDVVYKDNSSTTLKADKDSNTINSVFDVFVINNQLIPKSVKKNQGRFTSVTTTLEVEPVVLIDKIIPKKVIAYSISSNRSEFGVNGKILPNIENILEDVQVIGSIYNKGTLSKFSQVGINNQLLRLKDITNDKKGNKEQILENLDNNNIDDFNAVPHIDEYIQTIKRYGFEFQYEVEYFFAALQIIDAYKSSPADFKEAFKYASYEIEKKDYLEIFSSFKSTWKELKPVEDKDMGFVVKFPNAKLISNGERDVISFLALLLKAKGKLKKEKAILVIDEVFDYLDDANLTACQYYVTKIIKEMKSQNKQIFPLIMTHLNPFYFKNFAFSDQKVYYLQKRSGHINRDFEKVILAREDRSVEKEFKDSLSKYFVHFHSEIKNEEQRFTLNGLPQAFNTSEKFKSFVFEEFEKYSQGQKNYDPIAVCTAVRIKIESKVYDLIDSDYQAEFLTTHKTPNKLDFAKEKGANVPEVYYLLGVIYNDGLHISKNTEYAIPIISKLSNLTIKEMIDSI